MWRCVNPPTGGRRHRCNNAAECALGIATRASCLRTVVEAAGEKIPDVSTGGAITWADVLIRSQAGGGTGAITPPSAPSASIATRASWRLTVVKVAGDRQNGYET